MKFKVILPWETSNTDMQLDLDLRDTFKKLREKSYKKTFFFIVSIELECVQNTFT